MKKAATWAVSAGVAAGDAFVLAGLTLLAGPAIRPRVPDVAKALTHIARRSRKERVVRGLDHRGSGLRV